MRFPANNAERLRWLFTAIAAAVLFAAIWYSRPAASADCFVVQLHPSRPG
jgi:hypothetical protein